MIHEHIKTVKTGIYLDTCNTHPVRMRKFAFFDDVSSHSGATVVKGRVPREPNAASRDFGDLEGATGRRARGCIGGKNWFKNVFLKDILKLKVRLYM